MDQEAKRRELEELRQRVRQLEEELAGPGAEPPWPPQSYYVAYHVLAGCVLGMFGAMASLLFNVVGSLLVGQHPLYLIQVYLTFPLKESGLRATGGLVLAIGCCLYLATGMLFGIPFHIVLSRWFAQAAWLTRFGVVSVLGVGLWLVNFYGILSWLQPLLFGKAWIVEEIPWWVAALTHLVFGWTMLLVQPLGTFVPYRLDGEAR
ncbi:MAG: hypothetical protein NZ700_06585 [Gemmataceae bacterium]|nr:hypothetical protein [Gemmataceae bacterium]MDW8267014.1 hypothetical protein [Gemmataceae bacterium]